MIVKVGIHVERVIGNLRKKDSLLDQTLPIDFLITEKGKKVPTLDKLVHIARALKICVLLLFPWIKRYEGLVQW